MARIESELLPSDMKKVLFVHHGGGIGGAPVSMLQLAASLDRERFDPTVVFTEDGPILDFARTMAVRSRVVRAPSAFFYGAHVPVRARMLARFVATFPWTLRTARRVIAEDVPDLVHLNTSVLVPWALAARAEGVPVVWHVREVLRPDTRLGRWEIGLIARTAARIVTNSAFVATAFDGLCPVTVVHNAVEEGFGSDAEVRGAALRRELGIPAGAPVVGIVGSVQKVKGHFLLLDAATEVARRVPAVAFLVVAGGAGPEYERSWKGRVKSALGLPIDLLEEMRRCIAAAGQSDRFRFTGFRRDIAAAIASMDVLAFPSLRPEGFGRPLIEAMAVGRPVVASDVGPTREIVGDGPAALVPPADATALAAALIPLLRDPEARRRMGQAGRKRFQDRFTFDRHRRAMEAIYEEATEVRSGVAREHGRLI